MKQGRSNLGQSQTFSYLVYVRLRDATLRRSNREWTNRCIWSHGDYKLDKKHDCDVRHSARLTGTNTRFKIIAGSYDVSIIHGTSPSYLQSCFTRFVDMTVWNELPLHVASAPSLAVFRKRLMTFLFSRSYQDTIIWLMCYYYHLSLLSGHCGPCND